MQEKLKALARRVLPKSVRVPLSDGLVTVQAALQYPKNRICRGWAQRKQLAGGKSANRSCRMFNYNPMLLPNPVLAELETGATDTEAAKLRTGLTVGYPAWNLLYYTLLCSLPPEMSEPVVVETGTNHGISTIVLAQALKDAGHRGVVRTVDIDPAVVEIARANVARAGLIEFVEFHAEDSLEYLKRLAGEVPAIHFAFLDGNHAYDHVRREFGIIHARVAACRGKVYFDNTTAGDVARALRYIRVAYGGNLIEFENCSWQPPGNVIWQL